MWGFTLPGTEGRGSALPAPYNTMVAPVSRNFLRRTCHRPLSPTPCGTSETLTRRRTPPSQPRLRRRPGASPLTALPFRTTKWRLPVRGRSPSAHRTVTRAADSQPLRSPAASVAPIGRAPRSCRQPRRAAPGCVCRWDGRGRSPRRGRRHGRRWVAAAAPSRGGRAAGFPLRSPRSGPTAGLRPAASRGGAGPGGPERRGLPRRCEVRP